MLWQRRIGPVAVGSLTVAHRPPGRADAPLPPPCPAVHRPGAGGDGRAVRGQGHIVLADPAEGRRIGADEQRLAKI